MRKILIVLIKAYQYVVSPWLGARCRFHPTCSNYALDALQLHGVIRGCMLIARRLLKCHPFHPGGIDFVPGQPTDKK